MVAEDAAYNESSPRPHRAAAGRPLTSATENKDQCHHERTAAAASLLQYWMQNGSSRAKTTSNHPRFRFPRAAAKITQPRKSESSARAGLMFTCFET